MKMNWKAFVLGLAALSATAAAEFPERNLEGIIQWAAGGTTDNVARSLTPHVEKALGKSVVLNNRPGGTGVIGMSAVMKRKADGYTLLYGAENPQLYQVLDLAKMSYADMDLINVIGQGLVVIVVPAESPYQSMADLLKAVQDKPDSVKMGTNGAGSLPATLEALVSSVADFKVRNVTFQGDGPGITALLGGHIDFMPLTLTGVNAQLEAGRLRALAVVATEKVAHLPDVPPITETLPEMARYLPWGPFWVVAAPKGLDADVKKRLADVYEKAVNTEEFQTFLTKNGGLPLNLRDQAAVDFVTRWQSVTAWAMEATGTAKVSPEALGIAKP